MRRALDEGIGCFVEIGPGDVLSGMMRRIDRNAERISISDPAGVVAFAARLQSS
jgi:[acyl-carrier-protein] S-malonyltransferase